MNENVRGLVGKWEARADEYASDPVSLAHRKALKDCAAELEHAIAQQPAGEAVFPPEMCPECRYRSFHYRPDGNVICLNCKTILALPPTPADSAPLVETTKGWRIIPATVRIRGERWEIYDPDGNGGGISVCDVQDETVQNLLDALAAAKGGK